jgi:hypothetical protein
MSLEEGKQSTIDLQYVGRQRVCQIADTRESSPDGPTIQRSNGPTVQRSNGPTVQRSNGPREAVRANGVNVAATSYLLRFLADLTKWLALDGWIGDRWDLP